MSVMLKRPGSEEGLDMPVKEVITRMMLCVMFGLDDKEDIHIYNSKGEKVAFLFCLDSSFAPQTAGDYVIMLDSEVKQTADDKQKTGGSKSASSLESSTSIHSDEYPVLNTQPGCSKDMQERVERQFALLKRPGCEEGIELDLSMPISKGMICELFGLDEGEKLIILTRLRFSETLSEECSLRSKDELFSPRSASIFTVMTESEFMREQGSEDLSHKAKPKSKLRPLLTPTVFSKLPSNLFHRIMKTMSYDAFIRLAMTCREMMSILQMKGIVKASPLTLTVTLNELPNEDEQAVLLLARKHHPNYFCAEILPYYLSDLRPFVLEGIRVKGDATAFVPKECLPSACHEIQRHKVAFKTLFSVYNRLPIAVELLEILKPKRAEISLASRGKGDYGEGFTGRQWPFVNVGEELKLITSSFDYIEDMNKYRGIFHFTSQLKIFQAFCICRLSFSATELIFREFLADPEMGNIQMIQFLYPEILNRNADIFGGIPRFFEGEYRQKTTDANRTEVRPRIRAGIISNNGEKAAIVESRNFQKMSAVFKRTGSNEGIEMPIKEVITRMMLSVMFGLDEKKDLHIFNVKGQKVAFLFSPDSSFTPQTPGDYIIKDSELSILGSFMQKFSANKDEVDPQALSVALLNKCPPDSWVIPSSQPGCSRDTRAEEARQYAQLKRPGCEEGIELELGVPITKGMICELFGLGEIEKLTILVSSVVFPNTLSEECSLWCKDDLFCPNSSDVYIAMTGAEMEDREHGNDVLGPHKTLILKKPSMFEKIPSNLLCRILNRLSLKTFGRLAITCHEMLPILQLNIKVKESPHILTIITNETNSNEYGLLLARKQPTYMGSAEIHSYYLGDLKAFVLEGVRAKGDPTTSPKACLLRACQEIRRQKLAFKTFYSIKNRLTTVVEMLEILKPRRAEIWLVSFSNRYRRELDYGEGFTGRQWPFGNVGEELKLITSTFDYIREMNYDRHGMFYMISGLKIFQAFSVLPSFYSVTDDVLRNFRKRPETGNIQLIQFLYPDRRNSNIFDGISRIFEETYRMASQRLEVGPRIRAGILSENGERIAIVETRKYSKYRLVSMSFTAFDGYETQLSRIYREFDNIHFTIDQMFME